MDYYLDQLFLEFPNPNTLGRLLYDGALKFENRKWLNTKSGPMSYKMADTLASEIAAFLKENGHHLKSYLFINNDCLVESSMVLLAAIKAGITLVDAPVHPPLVRQNFIDNKQLLVFEKNRFISHKTEVSYDQAVKQGKKALFFNIPPVEETHYAFYFFDKDDVNGLQASALEHKTLVKQIYSAATGNSLHPYIRVVYHWFNGFEAPL